jgi:hypothetical protein
MKKSIILVVVLFVALGCSRKIKSITEFSFKDSILVKNRTAEFNKQGDKVLEQYFGNARSNRITKSEYQKGVKISEIDCDYFQKQDTCVLRQFSKFEYDSNNRLLTETKFEEDSVIRFIRKHYYFKGREVSKTIIFDMLASKQPDFNKGRIYIDTIYYDKLKREIKRISNSPNFEKPVIEFYKYTKSGYSRELTGTFNNDTVLSYRYNKLQKKAIKNKIDFNFYNVKRYKYKFDYY